MGIIGGSSLFIDSKLKEPESMYELPLLDFPFLFGFLNATGLTTKQSYFGKEEDILCECGNCVLYI